MTDLDVYKVINDKVIDLKKVLVTSPEIEIDEYDLPPGRVKPEKQKKKRTLKLSLALPKGFNMIDIGEIRLQKGKILYRDHRKDTLRETGIPEFSIEVDRIHIDSTVSANLFNAEDIRVTLKGITKTSKNGMTTVSLGEIGLSTGKKGTLCQRFPCKTGSFEGRIREEAGIPDRLDGRESERDPVVRDRYPHAPSQRTFYCLPGDR